MKKDDKIFVAGHLGMVGSALLRALKSEGYSNFALRSHDELDLTIQEKVRSFFEEEQLPNKKSDITVSKINLFIFLLFYKLFCNCISINIQTYKINSTF